ncbi:MAG TPA: carbohydrate binding domain-containing protein [Tepidiformaceae bacterium]
MIAPLRRFAFDFEEPRARANALLLLLIAAVISPNIGMPGGLPAIRLEQLLLLLFLPSMVLFHRRHPEFLRPRLLDFAFLALAGATAISILLAPLLVSQVTWSIRDPFEVARVVQYWLLFRLALTVVPSVSLVRSIVQLLLIVVIAGTVFSVLQYLLPGSFNDNVTALWTAGHSVTAINNTGRVVGTVGNANYYAILSSFLLALALSLVILRARLGRSWRMLAMLAVLAGSLSIVLAQSRTAALASTGAFAIALGLVALRQRRAAAYLTATGLLIGVVLASMLFVEVASRDDRVNERFNPYNLLTDSSVTTRLTRWRSFFSGTSDGTPPRTCNATRLESASPAAGYAPAGPASSATVSSAALARDELRKEDVASIAYAIREYFCVEGHWPAAEGVESSLVPAFLTKWPRDPRTREPYLLYLTPRGFAVGATLENPADPEGPVYGLGTFPNMVPNPSFESDELSEWLRTYGASAEPTSSVSLFGEKSASVTLTAAKGEPPGGIIHRVIFEFALDTDYTFATWVRNDTGSEQQILLYLSGRTGEGLLLDGMTKRFVSVPADGQWIRLDLPFTTPDTTRLTEIHIGLYSPTADGVSPLYFDGLTLQQGTFAPHFPLVRTVVPSNLRPVDLPAFQDSPLIGTGPGNSLLARRVLDNEYLLFLDRYGIVGTAAYIALFAAAFAVVFRVWWTTKHLLGAALALAILTFTEALAVFNVAAGSFYHFQIMAVYWLLIGLLSSVGEAERHARAIEVSEQAPAAQPLPNGTPAGALRYSGLRRLGKALAPRRGDLRREEEPKS